MAKVGLIYATSLFSLCEENNITDKIFGEFSSFVDVINKNESILKVPSSPIFEKTDKKDLVEKLLYGTEKTFINFMKVLIEKGRENAIVDSFNEFKQLYLNKNNKVVARVYTAVPLSNEQKEQVKEIVKRTTNKVAIIEEEIDKGLIMGLKILVDGKEIDLSLSGSFKRLEENLKKRIEVSG